MTTPGATYVVPAGYGEVSLAPGWVSPGYGVKHPAPVVLVAAEDRSEADLLTVVTPGPDAPRVSARAGGSGLAVEVETTRGRQLRLRLTPTGVSLDRGPEARP